MAILELLFAPLMLILTVCFWRARSGWRIVKMDVTWHEKLKLVAYEVLYIIEIGRAHV